MTKPQNQHPKKESTKLIIVTELVSFQVHTTQAYSNKFGDELSSFMEKTLTHAFMNSLFTFDFHSHHCTTHSYALNVATYICI